MKALLNNIDCTLRKTNEEVVVVAYQQAKDGERRATDWVSYIDSKGAEHIKEKLTFQFDFKQSDKLSKALFDKLMPQDTDLNDMARKTFIQTTAIAAMREMIRVGWRYDSIAKQAVNMAYDVNKWIEELSFKTKL